MHDPVLFERNMLAIASHHPVASAERLRSASSDMRLGMDEARDGSPLPYLDYAGRRAYMSSRMQPLREAQRLADEYTQSGFFVFLGLGPGFLAKALLESGRLSSGIIIEYRAGTLRAILERMDLTRVLADKRLLLLVDPSDEELEQAMVERYMPAVSGDIVTVPLASRVDAEQERFQGASRALRAILDKVSDDYSVQAFFGKRWFANIVRNLRYAAGNTPPVGPVREAIIAAAGPSLEDAISELAGRTKQRFLIATDTSLHALLKRGIMPDAVLSIDCQHISYYHFMNGVPEGLPLFLDLASPTTLAKLSERPYFFSSGHPLTRYVASRMRAYPQLDTSGGNVTHAAVSLAEYLGAGVIDIYGADFSYPFGKSYARGTYIYPYFDLRQSRLRPQEGLFQDFLYRNQSLERQCDPDGDYRYLTKPLGAYLRRMEGLAASSEALLRRHRGGGAASLADYDEAKPLRRRGFGRVFAAGKLFMTPREFLSSYRSELLALPKPPSDPGPAQAAQYIQALQGRDRDIWTTLLPSVAAFRREAGSDMQRMRGVLAEVLAWSIALIDEELKETS
jgi:hypothetical protein